MYTITKEGTDLFVDKTKELHYYEDRRKQIKIREQEVSALIDDII
jgi:predicted transcriptional regulator